MDWKMFTTLYSPSFLGIQIVELGSAADSWYAPYHTDVEVQKSICRHTEFLNPLRK